MRIKEKFSKLLSSIYSKSLLSTFFVSFSISLLRGLLEEDLDYFWQLGIVIWVFISIPIVIFIFVARRLTSGLAVESFINKPNSEAVDAVLKQLRIRSKVLRGISILALLLIALCIFVGVYIFVSASTYSRTADLIRYEIRSDSLGKYQNRKVELEQALTKINVYGLAKYLKLYPEEAYKALNLKPEKSRYSSKSADKSYKKSLDNFIKVAGDESRQSSIKDEITNKHASILDKINNDKTRMTPNSDRDGKEDLYFLLSTTITRIGTILLILFLVRILLELYRYSAKLGAFYDARGDSIQLSPKDTPEDLIMSLAFFSTDSVEFKNNIEGPYDRIYKLAEIYMGKIKGSSNE